MEISNRQHRPAGLAVWRGMLGRCPHCGEGRLFYRFLKVADKCDGCGTAFHHHRADDLPAYLVILIVGHIVVASMFEIESYAQTPLWLQEVLWPSLVVVLSLALIQPIKGAVIGLQWSHRMHGFGENSEPLPDMG
jgi:uncharacterized protein (DUF983 family)